ncbi:MAG: acyltransferase [Crocinitomicaceae bacterium]|nr:acyltransferase [Crocinitomicaceae bacterium]NGF74887.1 acyltransferase [Fluviicola sp. SGL-29]
MIYNYLDQNKKIISKTGVSSSTFIDYPQFLELGTGVYIGHHNFIEASNGLIIEDGCQITNFITITTHSSHTSIRLYGVHYGGKDMIGYVKGSVKIGKYTFVGPHSTIMPGTTIGKGSLIAAYSYVQGEFPDFSIIAGNPARIIGDTREKDQNVLEQHPELKKYYENWTKD